jgi:hypothetical protein
MHRRPGALPEGDCYRNERGKCERKSYNLWFIHDFNFLFLFWPSLISRLGGVIADHLTSKAHASSMTLGVFC